MSETRGWSAVPNWVIRSKTLKGTEKWVYIALLNRANQHGICHPSLKLLCDDVDVSKPTMLKALDSLEQKGLIERRKRHVKGVGYTSNAYLIHSWTPSKESLLASKNEYQGLVKPVDHPSQNQYQEVLPREVLPSRSTTHIGDSVEKLFDRAYSVWPKKQKRKESFDKFKLKAKKRDPRQLVADIERFAAAYIAAGKAPQYVPALSVWLNGERWDDDLPTAVDASEKPTVVGAARSVAEQLRAMGQ